jgi:hypothetical protein
MVPADVGREDDREVANAVVDVVEHLTSRRGHVGRLVVLARERPHGIPRLEQRDGRELHIAAEQVGALKTADRAQMCQHVGGEQSLIGIGVVGSGAPQSSDHVRFPSGRWV